jgi:hypothetical protein
MPIASRSTRSSRSTEAAGQNHPLVRGEQLRADFRRQSLVTALALLLGSLATGFGWTWGLPLLVAAGLVQVWLGVSLAFLDSLQHERALELIGEGESLPLPGLERGVQRLSRPCHSTGLARALEDLVQIAERWPKLIRTSRPVFDPRTVRAAATELGAIAACLRTGEVSARALARVERLLTSGRSPLYGTDADELKHELHRIRLELQ